MRQRGFTLLEIVIATFIFLVMVTAVASMWTLHAQAQMRSASLLVAADLADLEMERTLALGYHNALSTTGNFSQTWEVRGQPIIHRFETTVDVVERINPNIPIGGIFLPGFKTVEVTVTYNDGQGIHGITSYMVEDV